MLTIDDINNKKFSYQMKGYNKREVDEFLDRIAIDYQAMAHQNVLMQQRVAELTQALNKEKGNDVSKKDTIDEARRIMNDISASAEHKAEMIINKAKADAEEIKKNAAESTANISSEANGMRDQLEQFRLSFRKMLTDQIEELDNNTGELLSELRRTFPEKDQLDANAQVNSEGASDLEQKLFSDKYAARSDVNSGIAAAASNLNAASTDQATRQGQAQSQGQAQGQGLGQDLGQAQATATGTKTFAGSSSGNVGRNTLIYQTPKETEHKLSEPDLSEFINTDSKPEKSPSASSDPLSAYIEVKDTGSSTSKPLDLEETKIFSQEDMEKIRKRRG